MTSLSPRPFGFRRRETNSWMANTTIYPALLPLLHKELRPQYRRSSKSHWAYILSEYPQHYKHHVLSNKAGNPRTEWLPCTDYHRYPLVGTLLERSLGRPSRAPSTKSSKEGESQTKESYNCPLKSFRRTFSTSKKRVNHYRRDHMPSWTEECMWLLICSWLGFN